MAIEELDAIIVGGGPAGLSGALILGRCRRKVLLFDDANPRNRVARESHGYFTRDGADAGELRRIGLDQLRPYPVSVRRERVVDARKLPDPGGFEVVGASQERFRARTLLLATGVRDRLPAVAGLEAINGSSAWTCPYCDGWECRDTPLAVYARGREGVEFALALTPWTNDLVLMTDGQPLTEPDQQALLEAHGIGYRPEPIERLVSEQGKLTRVLFRNGESLERTGLFYHLGAEQQSDLAARLGCRFTPKGCVFTDHATEATGIDGLYVAGDASHDLLLLPVAVAEGFKAGFAINKRLREARSRSMLRGR